MRDLFKFCIEGGVFVVLEGGRKEGDLGRKGGGAPRFVRSLTVEPVRISESFRLVHFEWTAIWFPFDAH